MHTQQQNCGAAERRASRKIARVAVLVACAAAAHAQAPADSLNDRLRRAEAAIAALQQQIADQSESAARAKSGLHLEVTGRVALNAFANSRRVNNVDDPQFVLPDVGVPARGVGMAIRQTRLGLALRSAPVLGGAFTGDVDMDFFGGQQPSSGGRTFPLLRMRTARAIVRWTSAQLLIGQESPLIGGLNPVSPAAVGTPDFAGAGNLWLWLPQIRVGIEQAAGRHPTRPRFGVAAAVLAPTSGDPATAFDTDFDLAERSQRPFLQARAHVKWGEGESLAEIGCGVHQGWLMPAVDRVVSRALACDAVLPMFEALELRTEVFAGEGLRGLGGGGIGQNFTSTNSALKTKGGWAQLNARTEWLRYGAGCGIDHPDAAGAPTRRRNDACATYFTVRPEGPLFFGAELRRIRTEYATGRYTNDHVTFSMGFEF